MMENDDPGYGGGTGPGGADAPPQTSAPVHAAPNFGERAREFFALAAEVARVQFDPGQDWIEFVQALWEQVDAGYGLTPDEVGDVDVPHPWFDDPDDPPVIVWGAEEPEGFG